MILGTPRNSTIDTPLPAMYFVAHGVDSEGEEYASLDQLWEAELGTLVLITCFQLSALYSSLSGICSVRSPLCSLL